MTKRRDRGVAIGLLAGRLGDVASRLQTTLRRRFAEAEVSLSQGRTLSTLAARGPQRLTDLALMEEVTQPSMSILIARLERQGLVERRTDEIDSRTTLICMTDEGLVAWRSIVALRKNLYTAGLALLSEVERSALLEALPALEHLAEVLQETDERIHLRR